jgi:hypothetical protein
MAGGVVAGHAQASEVDDVRAWAVRRDVLHQRIADRFVRAEPRCHALADRKGLLGNVPRRTVLLCVIPEGAGTVNPWERSSSGWCAVPSV